MILLRTPYGVGGEDPKYEMRWFGREGFIFVMQDVRGRNGSEGEFVHVRPMLRQGEKGIDESTDAWDTVDWLVKNVQGSNGRVGLVGSSYPGMYALEGGMNAHPAVKCAVVQAPVIDWFAGDDLHHNGAFCLAQSYPFLAMMAGKPVTMEDGYGYYLKLGAIGNVTGLDQFWDQVMGHGVEDAFWKERDVREHLGEVSVPMMTVGGWFDAEDLFGTLAAYRGVEKVSGPRENVLVMGPWSHGGWMRGDGEELGEVKFGGKTAEWYRREVEIEFLKKYLNGEDAGKIAEATVFETGVNRWRRFATWPPEGGVEREMYSRSGGRLSFEPVEKGEGEFDEYVSDPARPVPFVEKVGKGVPAEFMVGDQRFAESRGDVLGYKTETLAEDVRVMGPVGVDLRVSTSGTDADWVVKVIDVWPSGYEQLLRGDVMRGKFREGLGKEVAFEPGKVTEVKFEMADVCHTFLRGHRVMVQVQSSWFPLFDRNPQVFCDIYHVREGDYQKAVERVYHGVGEESGVWVRVMSGDVLGK
jgi:hypothetical protein